MSRRVSARLNPTAPLLAPTLPSAPPVASILVPVPASIPTPSPALIPTPSPPKASLTSLPGELKLLIAKMARASDRAHSIKQDAFDMDSEVEDAHPRTYIKTLAWGKAIKMLSNVSREWSRICLRLAIVNIGTRQLREKCGHLRVLPQLGLTCTRSVAIHRPDLRNLPNDEGIRTRRRFREALGELYSLLPYLGNVTSLKLSSEFIVDWCQTMLLSEANKFTTVEDENALLAIKMLCRSVTEVSLDSDTWPLLTTSQLRRLLPLITNLRRATFTSGTSPFAEEYDTYTADCFEHLKQLTHLSIRVGVKEQKFPDRWLDWAAKHLRLQSLVVDVFDDEHDDDEDFDDDLHPRLTKSAFGLISKLAPTLESLTINSLGGVEDDVKFETVFPRLHHLSLGLKAQDVDSFLRTIATSPLTTLDISKSRHTIISQTHLSQFASLTHVRGSDTSPGAAAYMRAKSIRFEKTTTAQERFTHYEAGDNTNAFLLRMAQETIDGATRMLARNRLVPDAVSSGMLLRALDGVREYLEMDAELGRTKVAKQVPTGAVAGALVGRTYQNSDSDSDDIPDCRLTKSVVSFISKVAPTLQQLTINSRGGVDSNVIFETDFPLLHDLSLGLPPKDLSKFLDSVCTSSLTTLDISQPSAAPLLPGYLTQFSALRRVRAEMASSAVEGYMSVKGIHFDATRAPLDGQGHDSVRRLLELAQEMIHGAERLWQRSKLWKDKVGAGMLVRALDGVRVLMNMDAE
ncbi:hypothetical protein P7C70_g8268, partial [Phenoliferia sp. Uapishka_3]